MSPSQSSPDRAREAGPSSGPSAAGPSLLSRVGLPPSLPPKPTDEVTVAAKSSNSKGKGKASSKTSTKLRDHDRAPSRAVGSVARRERPSNWRTRSRSKDRDVRSRERDVEPGQWRDSLLEREDRALERQRWDRERGREREEWEDYERERDRRRRWEEWDALERERERTERRPRERRDEPRRPEQGWRRRPQGSPPGRRPEPRALDRRVSDDRSIGGDRRSSVRPVRRDGDCSRPNARSSVSDGRSAYTRPASTRSNSRDSRTSTYEGKGKQTESDPKRTLTHQLESAVKKEDKTAESQTLRSRSPRRDSRDVSNGVRGRSASAQSRTSNRPEREASGSRERLLKLKEHSPAPREASGSGRSAAVKGENDSTDLRRSAASATPSTERLQPDEFPTGLKSSVSPKPGKDASDVRPRPKHTDDVKASTSVEASSSRSLATAASAAPRAETPTSQSMDQTTERHAEQSSSASEAAPMPASEQASNSSNESTQSIIPTGPRGQKTYTYHDAQQSKYRWNPNAHSGSPSSASSVPSTPARPQNVSTPPIKPTLSATATPIAGVPLAPRAFRASSSSQPAPPPPPPDQPPPPEPDELPPPPPPPEDAAPSPPPPPPPLSFGHVPLPNELDINDGARNFKLVYDPLLDRGPSRGKDSVKLYAPGAEEEAPLVSDPRLLITDYGKASGRGRMKYRAVLERPHYEWDANSTGPRPPPPPRALLVTQLSALTTAAQVHQHFRSFGRIEESELKLDPQTGQSLGIYWLKFAHDLDENGHPLGGGMQGQQNGNRCAIEAKSKCDGQKLGMDVIKVVLDDEKKKYVKTYREELGKRYPPKPKAKPQPQPHHQAQTPVHNVSSASPAPHTQGTIGVGTALAPQHSSPFTAGAGMSPATPANMPPPTAPRGPRAQLAAQAQQQTQRMYNSPQPEFNPAPPMPRQQHPRLAAQMANAAARAPSSPMQTEKPKEKSKKVDEDDMDTDSDEEEPSVGSPLPNVQAHNQVLYGNIRRGKFGLGGAVNGFVPKGRNAMPDASQDKVEDTAAIMQRLAALGTPYVFVSRVKSSAIGVKAIRRHFNGFLPTEVAADESGWYVAFKSKDAAHRCRMVLDKSTLFGYHISIVVRDPPPSENAPTDSVEQTTAAAMPPIVNGIPTGPRAARDQRGAVRMPRGMQRKERIRGKQAKSSWTDEELAEEAREMILRELGEVFIRDLKNRVVNPFVSDFLAPTSAGGRILAAPPEKKEDHEPAGEGTGTTEPVADDKLPSFRKLKVPAWGPRAPKGQGVVDSIDKHDSADVGLTKGSDGKKRNQRKVTRFASVTQDDHVEPGDRRRKRTMPPSFSDDSDEEVETIALKRQRSEEVEQVQEVALRAASAESVEDVPKVEELATPGPVVEDVAPVSKSKKATKAAKKSAKAQVQTELADEPTEVVRLETPPVLEEADVQLDLTPQPPTKPWKKSKAPIKPQRPRSPTPDPFASGIAEDEEDLYYAQLALLRMRAGESVAERDLPEVDDQDGEPAAHESGSARTEGYYRIPASQKAVHLPDRNKAIVDTSNISGLHSSRTNRADSRRLVLGIEQHKKDMASDTDILKFNQLRTRKKQLKFAKSPIHDWGLYAMELIPAGDMVIEYVGEVVRQQVADERERQYERQGNFSTYLFRVDDDLVVDATHKGNIARLMNHCCTPNCNAKILTLNGEKKIVLYAKQTILPGQELTYDYKFQSSGDDEEAITCLCGSPGCRGFL